jgi:hypothetical protein
MFKSSRFISLNALNKEGGVENSMAVTYMQYVREEEDERRELLGWLGWVTERNGPGKFGPS